MYVLAEDEIDEATLTTAYGHLNTLSEAEVVRSQVKMAKRPVVYYRLRDPSLSLELDSRFRDRFRWLTIHDAKVIHQILMGDLDSHLEVGEADREKVELIVIGEKKENWDDSLAKLSAIMRGRFFEWPRM